MAARLLLTLLALLTSLAAQLTPAQARVRACGESEIGLSLGVVKGERLAVSQAGFAARTTGIGRARVERSVIMPRPKPGYFPAVQLRIDRARE